MDFLKSAVASAMAKGSSFPYSFGDRVDLDQSIWTLQNGTRREDGSPCSIFSFDITSNRSRLPIAKNALRKLRTLRHPGVIKVLDTAETDTYIYIATERLVPLRWHIKRKSLSPETLKWGLCSVARTVKFINDEASSIHGGLKVASIYTSESGEWKLGGFEVLSSVKEDDAVIYTYGGLVPDSSRYAPPEIVRGGWEAIKKNPLTAVDSYSFGTLIFEAFNGDFTSGDAGQTKGIPPTMHSSYKRLVNANPKSRVSVGHFLDQGVRTGAFFDTPLIKLTDGVDNLGVKSPEEREEFLSDLDQLTDDFPEEFFKAKVLPELLKSVEFGGGGPKAFSVVMKIATKLPSDDFDTRVTPAILRLFQNPDRAIRVCLLNNLPLMVDKLSQKMVNDKIFPDLVGGFTDLAPVVREQTLKSVLVIIGKLSDRTINGELLRCLAKTANDEQPGIRTNTTICLGKIAKHLGSSSRSKILIAAFTRSLRDPFVHARSAALMALTATSDVFNETDIATKILPAICPQLIDKEKLVRDQATRAVEVYMARVEKAAASMPETTLSPQPTGPSGEAPRMSSPQPTESAAVAWAGWAISSFTNKVSTAAGEIQPASNGTTPPARTTSEPRRPAPSSSSSASALHRQALASPPPSTRPSTAGSFGIAEAFQDDANGDDHGDAWGDMDDMDDNDDAGDDSASNPFATPTNGTKSPPVPSAHSLVATNDDGEPDFAGWLAAQQKKTAPGGKPLPKGLSKPGSSTILASRTASGQSATAKKPVPAARSGSKSVVAKKLDMKPKEDEGDDGWGDGW